MFGWNGTLPFPLLRRVADVINPLMNWLKINERIDYKLPFPFQTLRTLCLQTFVLPGT